MANGTDSIERIAADILISAIGNAHPGDARGLLDAPEKIAEQYKTIHEAVQKAQDKRQGR